MPERTELVASEISVHYQGVRAVDSVDLILERGAIMGLIGPNGAGKTTFLNAVSQYVPISGGRVSVDGMDVTAWKPHRLAAQGVVRTFQEVATFPELTVRENVELGALGSGLSRRRARERTSELLKRFDLATSAELYASALSHGSERMLGIARAVAAAPKYLLLDEPAAGLDDAESLALADTIVEIRDDLGCGVLLVEHDMRIIFRVCQSIQVLDFGKTLALGPPQDICRDRGVVAAYLGQQRSEHWEGRANADLV